MCVNYSLHATYVYTLRMVYLFIKLAHERWGSYIFGYYRRINDLQQQWHVMANNNAAHDFLPQEINFENTLQMIITEICYHGARLLLHSAEFIAAIHRSCFGNLSEARKSVSAIEFMPRTYVRLINCYFFGRHV